MRKALWLLLALDALFTPLAVSMAMPPTSPPGAWAGVVLFLLTGCALAGVLSAAREDAVC